MEKFEPKTLNKKEKNFCELYVLGCEPYLGNLRKCYEDVFKCTSDTVLKDAKELLERSDVAEYITYLRNIANYEAIDIKNRLTEKLLKIVEETSTAIYRDRRGTLLSPAPLRSVAVQASKALMDMYPVKVAHESKLELAGKAENGGIVINVVAPSAQE